MDKNQDREMKQKAKESLTEVKQLFKQLMQIESSIGTVLEMGASRFVRRMALAIFEEEDYARDIADELDWEYNNQGDYDDDEDRYESPGSRYRTMKEDILDDLESDILSREQSKRLKMYNRYTDIYDIVAAATIKKMLPLKSRLDQHFRKYIDTHEKILSILKENEEAINHYRNKWYRKVWEGLVGSIEVETKYIGRRAAAIEAAIPMSSQRFANEFLGINYLNGKDTVWPVASHVIGDRYYIRMITG